MGTNSKLAIVALSLIASCHNGSSVDDGDAGRLSHLVRQYRKDEPMSKLRSILVVTEESCPTCNKSFALLVDNYLEDSTSLVWVSATGSMVDITPFRSKPDRVVWDYGDSLQALGIIHGSGAIFLEGGRSDTVVQLDARNLENSLTFVANRMDAGPIVPANGVNKGI
ncbi:MAG: hypothetical protein IPN44_13320 [Flavobacteriales bacterium]|nr:hypothetical protein [Flavobacteriales bacterium]